MSHSALLYDSHVGHTKSSVASSLMPVGVRGVGSIESSFRRVQLAPWCMRKEVWKEKVAI